MMRILPIRYGVKTSTATDPYADSVISLLHFENNLSDETGKVWEKNVSAITSYTPSGLFGAGIQADLNNASPYTFRTTTPVSIPIGSGDFTMEIWFKTPEAFPATWNRNICAIGNGVRECQIILRSQSTPNPYFQCDLDGTIISATSLLPTTNAWYHLAMVRASGVLYFFVNGELAGTEPEAYAISLTETIYVGANGNVNWYQPYGVIDEFRLTSVARYTSTFTPPDAEFPNP